MNSTTPPDDDDAPLTLTREDLYELAWSKPLRELAKDFGISDVALAKRCRRLGIPVPGRGYWARIDAGQNPYRPKLPSREPQHGDRSALVAGPSDATPVEVHALRRDDGDEVAAALQRDAAAQDGAWLNRPGYSGELRVWVKPRWPDRVADDSTLLRILQGARDRWARAVGDC